MIITCTVSYCIIYFSGTFLASYCPSVSGCRAVVDFSSGTDSPDTTFIDLSDQHYTFTLNTDGDNVLWLVSRTNDRVKVC